MQKFLSFVLTLVMVAGLVPDAALAEAVIELGGTDDAEVLSVVEEPAAPEEAQSDVEPAEPANDALLAQAAQNIWLADQASPNTEVTGSLSTAHSYVLKGIDAPDKDLKVLIMKSGSTVYYAQLSQHDGSDYIYLDGLYQSLASGYEGGYQGYGNAYMAIPSGTYTLIYGNQDAYASTRTYTVASDGNYKVIPGDYSSYDGLWSWLWLEDENEEIHTSVNATDEFALEADTDSVVYMGNNQSISSDLDVQVEGVELYPSKYTRAAVETAFASGNNAITGAYMPTLASIDKSKFVPAWTPAGSGDVQIDFDDYGDMGRVHIYGLSFADAAIATGDYHPVLVLHVDDHNGRAYTCRYIYDPIHIEVGSVSVKDPSIITAALPQGVKGSSYAAQLTGKRGNLSTSSLSWSLAAGSTLPDGLSLGTDGEISGYPSKSGTFSFEVQLSESLGSTSRTVRKQLSISIGDTVALGDISYPKQYWSALQNRFNLSTPINLDLLGTEGYKASTAYYKVGYRLLDGSVKETDWVQAGIGASAITASPAIAAELNAKNPVVAITSIELSVELRASSGSNPSKVLKKTVQAPEVAMGGYVSFSALSWTEEGQAQGLSDLWNMDVAHINLWRVDEDGKAIGASRELTIKRENPRRSSEAFAQLEAGTYRFTLLGGLQAWGSDEAHTWVDITEDASARAVYGGVSRRDGTTEDEWTDDANTYGSLVGARKVAGTDPHEFELVVEPTCTTEVNVVYTSDGIRHYTAQVSYQGRDRVDDDWYEVAWYGTPKGKTEKVLIGWGDTADIPDTYTSITVSARPRGSDAAYYEAVEDVAVDTATRAASIEFARKAAVKVTGTIAWPADEARPVSGTLGSWGSIEVLTDTHEDYWTSRVQYLSSSSFTVAGVPAGSKLVYSPPAGSGRGDVEYSGIIGTADVTWNISAPTAAGTVTFEEGSLLYVDTKSATETTTAAERTTTFNLESPDTTVDVYAKWTDGNYYSVPFSVINGNKLVIRDALERLQTQTYKLKVSKYTKAVSSPLSSYWIYYGTQTVSKEIEFTMDSEGKATFMKETPTGTASGEYGPQTLTAGGRAIVTYVQPVLGYRDVCLYLYKNNQYVADGAMWNYRTDSGNKGTFSTPFLGAGTYELYAVELHTLYDQTLHPTVYQSEQTDFATPDLLEKYVLGDQKKPDSSKLTKMTFTIDANTVKYLTDTLTLPAPAIGARTSLVDADKSQVNAVQDFPGFLTATTRVVLADDALDFDANQGDQVWLDLTTNQKSNGGSGASNYVNLQSLTVNGRSIDFGRWNSGSQNIGNADLFGSGNAAMGNGELQIRLDHELIGLTKNASFPATVSITVSITDPSATSVVASLRVRKKTGGTDASPTYTDYSSSVGSFAEHYEEVSLEAPAVTAEETFTVYGTAKAQGQVSVTINGMQAARATADTYGSWTADITLPSGTYDGATYLLQARAQWEESGTSFSAVSSVAAVTYSRYRGAVKRVWMMWQDEPGGPYNYTLVYNKGGQPAQYQSFYRGWNKSTADLSKGEPKFSWMVEFTNADAVRNVSLVVPLRGSSSVRDLTWAYSADDSLVLSRDANTISGWFPAKSYPLMSPGDKNFENPWVVYDYWRLIQQQLKEGNTFVSEPRAFDLVPLSVNVEYDEAASADAAPAAERYAGFEGVGEGDLLKMICAVNQDASSRLKFVGTDTTTKASDLARALANQKDADVWLQVAVDVADSAAEGGTAQAWIGLHNTVKATDGADGYKQWVSDARTAEAAYDSFIAGLDESKDFDQSTYQLTSAAAAKVPSFRGEKIVSIVSDQNADDPDLVFFAWTKDSAGNAHLRNMERCLIEGTSDKYVYELTDFTYKQLTVTRWDEQPASGTAQTTVRTYTLHDSSIPRASTVDDKGSVRGFATVLNTWDAVMCSLSEGIEQGLVALDGVSDEDLSDHYDSTAHGALVAQSWVQTDNVFVDYTIGAVANGLNTSYNWVADKVQSGYNRHQEYEIIRQYLNDTNKADAVYFSDKVLSGDGQKSAWHETASECIGYLTDELLYTVGDAAASVATASGPVDLIADRLKGIMLDPQNSDVMKKVYYKNGAKKVNQMKLEDFSPEFQAAIVRLAKERQKVLNGGQSGLATVKPSKDMQRLMNQALSKRYQTAVKNAKMRLDPSGYVYEAVLSNRVEGATVRLYTYNAAGDPSQDHATLVDAKQFGYQDNPQVTGEDGRYQWDVAPGYWQVRVEKDGYDPVSTGDKAIYGIGATKSLDLDGDGTAETTAQTYWMPVLPEQLDVNIPLVSTEAPTIESVAADATGATVTFSKYVQVATVVAESFSVDGKTPVSVEPLDAEPAAQAAADGSYPQLARSFRLTYAHNATVVPGTVVEVKLLASQGSDSNVVSYAGTKAATQTVSATVGGERISIGGAAVVLVPGSATYTGSPIKPSVSVTLGGQRLVEGTDYTLAFKNNVNAGTATVTVTGCGAYKDSASKTFSIALASLSGATVSAIAQQAWTGQAVTPKPTVKVGSTTLKEGTDYTLSYANNVSAGTATVTVAGRGNWAGSVNRSFSIAKPAAHVAYRTHVQSFGWQGLVRDGAMSGTSGQSKRLEGIEIRLEGAPATGSVEYRTHVQKVGWQDYRRDGAMSGTSGRSLRLEAIQIRLTGKMAEGYDVWYRVHAQRLGWMGWAKDDAPAGTAGYAYRLEGIEIRVLPKGSAAPGSQVGAFESKTGVVPASSASGHDVAYRTHVQSVGWQAPVADGTASGTFGMAKRLEAIRISLPSAAGQGSVVYQTHVQSYGWQGWVRDGALSGTSGEAKRLEAIRIKLDGQVAQRYDVWYRVHAQTFGWMGWAKNGQEAGTSGYAKRLEAIQILVLPKGSKAPGTTANAFRKR